MESFVELELCPNCKKEIPQTNYVMHTMHCARNIALCSVCKEPIPKGELDAHVAKHSRPKAAKSAVAAASTQLGGATTTWKTKPYTGPFPEKLGHITTKPNKIAEHDLSPCSYCQLELPKDTLKEHEDYCGTRTDECIECGEFVMFKYKKLHEESNHGFLKLNDEPGPKPSWDSVTQKRSQPQKQQQQAATTHRSAFDVSSLSGSLYNMVDYLPPSLGGGGGGDEVDVYRPSGALPRDQRRVDYKDLSRRLDCKTEYIRNLLHDSASITAPLRTAATQPRNHFNHTKGPAPQPPAVLPRRSRRPDPPTELTIPCEFCGTPIPHEDLIQHETGCRPDLARISPRRRRAAVDDDDEGGARSAPSPPASPEVQLPCEFCADMIPASQLLRHQATCN